MEWMTYIKDHYSIHSGVFWNTGPPAFAKFVNLKGYPTNHKEWFGNTCDVLAIISRQELAGICRNDTNPIGILDYYWFNPGKVGTDPFDKLYTYTLWYEGSGWGAVTINNDKARDNSPEIFLKMIEERNKELGIIDDNIIKALELSSLTPTKSQQDNKEKEKEKENPKKILKGNPGQNLLWIFLAVGLAILVIVIIIVVVYFSYGAYKEKSKEELLSFGTKSKPEDFKINYYV
jgi:hypothetical protein